MPWDSPGVRSWLQIQLIVSTMNNVPMFCNSTLQHNMMILLPIHSTRGAIQSQLPIKGQVSRDTQTATEIPDILRPEGRRISSTTSSASQPHGLTKLCKHTQLMCASVPPHPKESPLIYSTSVICVQPSTSYIVNASSHAWGGLLGRFRAEDILIFLLFLIFL